MKRDDIQIISRHSNWSELEIAKTLKEQVYPDARAWKKFLNILLMSLGIGFTVSGVVFFFAYNWADLHKFAKMGMVEALIILAGGVVLFSKLPPGIKNMVLTGTSVLVGVLIAVFGQIYQTGANAYDFFMGWTLFICLWVVIANYAPLWLLFLVLVNTTFVLYAQQVAAHWSEEFVFSMLYLFNALTLTGTHLLGAFKSELKAPLWFTYILGLAAVAFCTIAAVLSIFDSHESPIPYLFFLTIIGYGGGLAYGLKTKSGFYLAVIPFSVIVIVSALLIRASDDASMFFLVSFFIIGSVTLLIRGLIVMNKKWSNGE